MKSCVDICREKKVACPNQECRYWMDFEGDLNCCHVAVEKYGPMKLREISERIGVSYVRIKHIQDAALVKLSKSSNKEEIFSILPD